MSWALDIASVNSSTENGFGSGIWHCNYKNKSSEKVRAGSLDISWMSVIILLLTSKWGMSPECYFPANFHTMAQTFLTDVRSYQTQA